MKWRWLIIGPFGIPVVPEESERSSGSSAEKSIGRTIEAGSRSYMAGSKRIASAAAIRSGPSSTRTARASKCPATFRRSASVQRESMGSMTAPIRITASIATT